MVMVVSKPPKAPSSRRRLDKTASESGIRSRSTDALMRYQTAFKRDARAAVAPPSTKSLTNRPDRKSRRAYLSDFLAVDRSFYRRMDVQTLAQWIDWVSDLRDTDPFVLINQYKANPRAAGEISTNANRLLDGVNLSTEILGLDVSLGHLEDEPRTRIFEQPEGFHYVLVGIVSKNFFCGLSKDDFSGPGASFVRYMPWTGFPFYLTQNLQQNKKYAYSLIALLDTTVRYLFRLLTDSPSPLLQEYAQHTLKELSPVWDRLSQLAPTSSWRAFEPTTDLDSTPIAIPAKCAARMGIGNILLYITLQ